MTSAWPQDTSEDTSRGVTRTQTCTRTCTRIKRLEGLKIKDRSEVTALKGSLLPTFW